MIRKNLEEERRSYEIINKKNYNSKREDNKREDQREDERNVIQIMNEKMSKRRIQITDLQKQEIEKI